MKTVEYKICGVIPVTVEYCTYHAQPDVGIMGAYNEIERVYYCDPHHKVERDINWQYHGLADDIYDAIRKAMA